jgi:DNA-binding beta-propeller fold protein YncE
MQKRNGVGPVLVTALTTGVWMQSGCAELGLDDGEASEELHSPKLDGEVWSTSQKDGVEFIIDKHGNLDGQIALPGAGPHITTFPPSQKFAYVGGMLDGKLYVINARRREVVTSLQIGPTLTHQAKPSPDGTALLVSVLSTQSVVKVTADEQNRTWTVGASASTSQFGKPPICTVWRDDGHRAYVSLNPSGIAILDVDTMTFVGQLATDGFVACGMIKSTDGQHVTIASSGSGGHIYTLDMATDTLTDRGSLGAPSWHSFIMTEDETTGFGTSPLSDQVIVIDLTTNPVTNAGAITFDSQPGTSDDQPDAVGGGELLTGKTLAVSLRAAGNIAFVGVKKRKILGYLHLSEPAPFNPATCQDCAVHGVTIRH